MNCAFLKQVFLLSFCVSLVCGDCFFHLNGEAIIEKKFGFHRIFIKKTTGDISLYNDENIIAYCETVFQDGNNYMEDHINIKCHNRNTYYRASEFQQWTLIHNSLDCHRSSGIELYESAQYLAKCKEYTSLAIAASALNSTSSIYAGICYDWNAKELKYVNYLAYKTKNKVYPLANKETELEIKTVSADIKIAGYETYMELINRDQFAQAYNSLKEKYALLEYVEFDYSNLMQDMPLQDVFEKYDDILSIMWWRNLRLINWRTFLGRLEERSRTVKYNVIIGTSGQIYIPNLENDCKTKQVLAVVAEEKFKKVAPVNVWAYLKAISGNSTDDFVVIGYNSPFFTAYDSSNVMCEDICESIEWMRTFGIRRLMPTMGLITCCRPADVVDKLDNFPWTAEVVAEMPKEDKIHLNSSSEEPTNPTSNAKADITDDILIDEDEDED